MPMTLTAENRILMLGVAKHLRNKALGFARHARDHKSVEHEKLALVYAEASTIIQAKAYKKDEWG